METVTDERLLKLSKTEQRKLKLAEYLAAKGRLKAPNTKPYLKDKPVAKKNTETYPKAKTAGDDKENCDINGTNVKEVKRVKSLAEIRNKAANPSSKTKPGTDSPAREKQHCSTISRNTSLKSTVYQASLQVVKGHSNRPASTQNPRGPYKTEKTALSQHQQNLQNVQSKVRQPFSHAANNTQKSTKSSLGPSQPKKELLSKRPLDKKIPSVNTVSVPSKTTSVAEKQLKSRRLANNTSDRIKVQTSKVYKAHTGLTNSTQQSRALSVGPKLGTHNSNVISRTSQSNPNKNQKKDLSSVTTKVDPTTRKSQNAFLNKTTRVSSTVSKPTNSDAPTVIKNKTHSAVKLGNVTASKQLFGRTTKSSVLPQTTTSTESQLSIKKSSQTKPAMQLQTPKASFCPSTQGLRTAPLEGRKMMTTAQEERLRKLQEWRESRGITYKRPPMPVRLVRRKTFSALPQPYWTAIEQEDEAHDIVFAVDRSLDDCIQLLQQGFPAEQVRDVLSRVPMAHKFAKFWICQAKLLEREGNLEVLPMFQEAVRVVREVTSKHLL
ncbi:cytoskeleton-associated protein 2-like [Triplophysa rosa]|uniref:Cytoskeleton-associated protein 2-like n=1 Tax=Triplophysa rosa TaxID=992332 RepID=A0A9W8CB47_TRIRA|nr:cytoskeleton-associated protein 2-like [Triplophysa rosa]